VARTADALVEGSLLEWARKASGLPLDAAAKKLSVDSSRLASWEAGASNPTVAQLRQMAELYKRPLAIFYLPEPPLRDYRQIPEARLGRLSPRLLTSIRRAHAVREAALELREQAELPVAPAPSVAVRGQDPEDLGAAARELLGVSLETQFAWTTRAKALNGWIEAVTALDVLVLQVQAVSRKEMRGFSIAEDRLPIIVLNGAEFPNARTFTLAHELAHIILNADGVCDTLPRRRPSSPNDEVEILCNQIAAAILMPDQAFRREPLVRAGAVGGVWSDDSLRGLSDRFSVSREAVVRRLYTLGLADWDFLQAKIEQYAREFDAYNKAAKEKRAAQSKPGGPSFYRMKVRDLGRGFIESALDAYYRRSITGSELSEYLEIKLNQVSRLEDELASTGGDRD